MNKELMNILSFDDHLDCFGEFNLKDLICKKLCALNLRCAIESEKNIRLEVLEGLVHTEGVFTKIQ